MWLVCCECHATFEFVRCANPACVRVYVLTVGVSLGRRNGDACYCGMSAQLGQNASLKRPITECQAVACSGDNTTKCGGVNRLLLYNYTITAQPGPWDPH